MVNYLAILLILVCSFIGAVGTSVIKKGTNKTAFFKLIFSFDIWVGLSLYALSLVFYMVALRQEHLSVLYPLVSTAYIWTTLFAVKYLGEKMNKFKWMALIGIVIGIILIGLGS